jgi:hypothetical protein
VLNTYNLECRSRLGVAFTLTRTMFPEFPKDGVQVCQLPQPPSSRVRVKLEDRLLRGADYGDSMTKRGMNPLNPIGRC